MQYLGKMCHDTANRRNRCEWSTSDPDYIRYHDTEWGYPVHDDSKQFEFLLLESFQAGLSWITILKKRENFRKAFSGFDAPRVASFTDSEVARCLNDKGIIRNRLKVNAAISNARALLAVRKEFGSFDEFLWRFVGGEQKVNKWRRLAQIPAMTPESIEMSKALKARGFKFVGPTVCYSHMQATGMVNDHLVSCFRHKECTV